MTIDEGRVLTGSLSDYVSGKLKNIADKKAETEKQMEELYLQRIAPLRDYLTALAAPMEALFDRFRVKELLEEARTQVGSRSIGPVHEWTPHYYRDIVLKPDPTKVLFAYGENQISLDALKGKEDFQKLIPKLRGFGFTLDIKDNDREVPVTETLIFYEQRRTPGSITYDINGISSHYSESFYTHKEKAGFSSKVNARTGHHMTITAVEPEGEDVSPTEYDLEYRVDRSTEEIFSAFPEITIDCTIALGLKRLGLKDNGKFVALATRNPINSYVFGRRIRIKPSEQLEVLVKIVGDDLVRWQTEWRR